MTIKKAKYLKEGTTEPKEVEILITTKDEKHENGINLKYLKEEEKEAVIELYRNFEEGLKPFMKAYRSYLKACFVE